MTLHEAAHGYVAYKLGDDTAYLMGRVTINPLKHIDLFGTIIIPILLMMTSGFIFGWAKPVPINVTRLRKPKRDAAIVALAGPFSNLIMAIIWAGILKLGLTVDHHAHPLFMIFNLMGQAGLMINLVLMVLNLIPIPPLDGSRFLSYLLPPPWDYWFNRITPFGILIILILIFTGVLSYVLYPAVGWLEILLLHLFQIR